MTDNEAPTISERIAEELSQIEVSITRWQDLPFLFPEDVKKELEPSIHSIKHISQELIK